MNYQGGSEYYQIRLSNEGLRRDANASMQQFDRVARHAMQTGNRIDKGFADMSRGMKQGFANALGSIKKGFMDIAKQMTGLSALAAGGTFLMSMSNETKEFGKEMRVVSTISEEVTNDMEGYKQKVENLCTQISIAPAEAARALYQINSAGHLGSDGLTVLEASAKLAVGGVTEVSTAADAVTTVLNAYGMKADQATAISDKLFTTVRLGKTDMSQLGSSIAQVAPVAASFGVSIDEVLALVAELTKQGTPTAAAMVQISQGIQQVTKVLGDGAFKTRNLLEAFQEVEERSKGSENALRDELGNVRALRAVLQATGAHAKETAQFIGEIANASGSTEEAFHKMNSLSGAQLRILRNNFLKAFRSIAEDSNSTIGKIAQALNEAFENGSMEKALTVLKDLLITYGIYKATIITITAIQKAYNAVMAQAAYQKALAAVQQKALTTAEALGAVVTSNLQRAWKAFTVALASNAVGLAITAIVALGVALYKCITAENEAEASTRRLNEATKKCTGEINTEKAKIDLLFESLKKAKKGTKEYEDAKKAIISQYGSYLDGLSKEIRSLEDVAGAYNAITTAASKAARARGLANFMEKEDERYAEDQAKNFEALYNNVKRVYGEDYANKYSADLHAILRGEKNPTAAFLAKFNRTVESSGGRIAGETQEKHTEVVNDIQDIINRGVAREKSYKETLKAAERRFDTTLAEALGGATTPEEEAKTKSYTQGDYDKLLKDAKNAKTGEEYKAAYEAIEPAMLKLDQSTAIYKQLKAAYDKAKKAYNATTSTSSGEHGKTQAQKNAEAVAANQELTDLENEQGRKRIEAVSEQEFEVWQARIDAMEEGAEKVRQQREHDQQKELYDLKKNMQAAIEAEVDAQRQLFNQKEEVAEKEAEKAGKKYAKKTFTSGDLLSPTTVLTPGTRFVGDTGNVEMERINDILDLYKYLEDLLTTKTVNTLTSAEAHAMNEYLREFGTFAEKRNAIIELANEELAKATSEGEKQSITARMTKDLAELDEEASKRTNAITMLFADMSEKSIKELSKLADRGRLALEFLKGGTWDKNKGASFGITKEMFELWSKSPDKLEEIEKVIRSIDNTTRTKTPFRTLANDIKKVTQANKDAKKAQEEYQKALKGTNDTETENANNTFKDAQNEKAKAVRNLKNSVKDTASAMSELLSASASIPEVLGIFGVKGTDSSASLLGGISQAFGTLASIDFNDTAAAINGAATALVQMLTALKGSGGEKDSWGIFTGDKHGKLIEKNQAAISKLEHEYEKLEKQVAKTYSKGVIPLINEENENLRKQRELVEELLKDEESNTKDGDKRTVQEYKNQLEEIGEKIKENEERARDAIFGEDIKTAIDNFADAYASMFEGGISKAKTSKTLVKDMIKKMIMEAMKADLAEPLEKLRLIISRLMYDGLDSGEEAFVDRYIDNLTDEIAAKYSVFDKFFKDTTTQNSSSGGFATMSQDTADELNGRFTGLQMSAESIRESMSDVLEHIASVRANIASNREMVEEIRNLQLLAVGHLENIAKNTRELYTMNEKLNKIQEHTSRL